MTDVHGHDHDRLTGAYSLDALDDLERARFEEHLASCEACRLEVDSFREAAARLAGAVAVPPSPGMRAALMAEVARTRQLPPVGRATASRAGRWGRGWTAAVAAAATITAGALAAEVVRLRGTVAERERTVLALEYLLAASDATMVDLAGPERAVVRVVMAPSHEDAVLLVEGLAPAPSDHAYELWLVHDQVVVSAGTFTVGADGHAMARISGDMATVTGIAVTLEPVDGSPVPTGERVAEVSLGA